MNAFGFVYYPEKGNDQMVVNGLAMDNGLASSHPPTFEDIETGSRPPTAVFYRRADIRDAEMDAMARRFPGMLFCPFDITTAVKYPPANKPARFSYSEKGFLPE